MKFFLKISCSLLLFFPFSIQANFSDDPGLARISAKHAKLRAKLRAGDSEEKNATASLNNDSEDSQNFTGQQVNINGADGCNLNVGNVLIDDTVRNPPNEVIVIIEGDIIQSNNCN